MMNLLLVLVLMVVLMDLLVGQVLLLLRERWQRMYGRIRLRQLWGVVRLRGLQ